MALARFPQLTGVQAVKEIAAGIGSEPACDVFIRRFSEGVGRIAAAFGNGPGNRGQDQAWAAA